MLDDIVLQVAPTVYWLTLGTAGAAVVWWRSRPRPRPRTGPEIDLRRRARLRSYRAQADAERRAEVLLREIVGDNGFADLIRRGHLEVKSPAFPDRVYLVPERQGPVTVCEHGRPIMRLCVQTVERVPDYDSIVMHKLMIEGNEREYLRIANRV